MNIEDVSDACCGVHTSTRRKHKQRPQPHAAERICASMRGGSASPRNTDICRTPVSSSHRRRSKFVASFQRMLNEWVMATKHHRLTLAASWKRMFVECATEATRRIFADVCRMSYYGLSGCWWNVRRILVFHSTRTPDGHLESVIWMLAFYISPASALVHPVATVNRFIYYYLLLQCPQSALDE